MTDHPELALDRLDSFRWDARAVGRGWKPRPLRGFCEGADVVLDARGCAEEEHVGGVRFDLEGVRDAARRERHQTDASAASAGVDPGGRIVDAIDQLGLDDPGGHLAVEDVERLILGVGMQRWSSTAREDPFPEGKPAAGVLPGQLHPRQGAKKPERITARVDHAPAHRLNLAHGLLRRRDGRADTDPDEPLVTGDHLPAHIRRAVDEVAWTQRDLLVPQTQYATAPDHRVHLFLPVAGVIVLRAFRPSRELELIH